MKRKMCQNQVWRLVVLICALLPLMTGCESGANHSILPPTKGSAGVLVPEQCSPGILQDAPTGYWPLDAHGFQGIFQFLGQTNPKNAANPSLAGADLEWSWAEIEPFEGYYNWHLVDRDINVWTSRGKPVILRFATGGQNSWSGAVNDSYTPTWLFDDYGVPQVVETNGTIFPLYWHSVYLHKLANFVNAVAARYDNNPYVVAVEIGVGQGGETEPDGAASNNPNRLQLWQRYGYTNALWWQTIRKIIGIYEAAWKHTPLVLMVTASFLEYQDKQYNRTLVERYAVRRGLWLQINALSDKMLPKILGGTGQLTTTIMEQGQSAQDSGYPLINDVRRGVELGARYVLAFAVDLAKAENAGVFGYATQQITKPVITDCSGHKLTMSITGRVAPMPGVSGAPNKFSQFFDGSTGTISNTGAPVTRTDEWSLEAWLYPTILPQTEALGVMNGADGSSGGGFGFGIAGGAAGGTGSHLVAYFPGIGWVDSGYTFSMSRQWYHVVVTRDGNTVRFYVNGNQTPSTSTLSPKAVAAHFSIGSGYDLTARAANHFFTGAIDEVATYASALTPAQIEAHYTAMN